MSSCTLNTIGGHCTGNFCSIGDLNPGSCNSTSLSYDCSSIERNCNQTLSHSYFAVETCASNSTSDSHSLTSDANSAQVEVTSTCPTDINVSTPVAIYNASICNVGSGIGRDVSVTFSSMADLSLCDISSNSESTICSGESCTTTIADLAPGFFYNSLIQF